MSPRLGDWGMKSRIVLHCEAILIKIVRERSVT